MLYDLNVVTPPVPPLIALAEVKSHLRVGIDDDDALIAAYTEAARVYVEETLTWRALSTRTLRVYFDAWNGHFVYLPYPPIQMVTQVTILDDENGTGVTLNPADYVIDRDLGRLRFFGDAIHGGGAPGRLGVIYSCGYQTGELPAPLWAAALLMVGHLYENRESVVVGAGVSAVAIPQGVEALALPYRAWQAGGAA